MPRKILISSTSADLQTGFSKNLKVLLRYLYSRKNPDGSKKWEVHEFAQGAVEESPKLRARPWKCYGGIPADESSVFVGLAKDSNGNHDPNLQRMVAYGAARIESVLKEVKPDIFLAVEDIWAMSVLRKFSDKAFVPYWETEWWDKFNTIIQTPVDSLPAMEMLLDGVKKSKRFFVKSSFAQKDLHRLGHSHVGLWPCLMEVGPYRVFDDEEKKSVRKKYGIDEDCLVFGFVSRNQTRKRMIAAIDGLKEFQTRNPGVKSKFVFCTNFLEGWNLKLGVEHAGLDPKDVLCAHTCHSCGETVLKEIEGPENDCPKCGTAKALKNISIEKGILENDLVELYNLFNGYVAPINSGGFELTVAEAAFAGVYTATVDYSFGEMFMESNAVFPITYAFDKEMGSLYKKAVPSTESICDFMEEVYNNPEESKQKGLKFREWAMKTIHPDVTLKTIEEYLDQLPISNYSFDFRTERLNPNAPFPTATDEPEFIKELVWNFFGNKINEDHQDFKTITQRFASGTTRQQIYEESKKMVDQKMGKPFDPSEFFQDNGKKRLMWDMSGDYGDSYIGLTVLDRLRELYPVSEWDIYVCCLPQYVEIYQHLDYITGFIPYTGVKHFELWEGTRNHQKWVDVWISPQTWRGAIHNGCDLQEFNPNSTNFRLTSGENAA
jgi:glycosyltransferase involved in cell wall biosynthesis